MYRNSSLQRYLEDLAAKKAAPGGGSASALTSALGASLVSMVVNFTLGKPKYAKYEAQLKAALVKSEKLKKEFLNLVDLDVTAYKSKNINDALRVPLKICQHSFAAIKFCPPLIKKGNINLISDVAVAAVLLEAGFTAAYFNVEINLKYLKDKEFAKQVRRELKLKERVVRRIRKETEDRVGKVIRG